MHNDSNDSSLQLRLTRRAKVCVVVVVMVKAATMSDEEEEVKFFPEASLDFLAFSQRLYRQN